MTITNMVSIGEFTRSSNNLTGEVSHHTSAESGFKFPLDSFIYKRKRCSFSPPLSFQCHFDEKTGLFEIRGVGDYEDILVYGEILYDAMHILRREILPILWEDSLNQDKAKLSERARRMAADFESRVEQYASENEGS